MEPWHLNHTSWSLLTKVSDKHLRWPWSHEVWETLIYPVVFRLGPTELWCFHASLELQKDVLTNGTPEKNTMRLGMKKWRFYFWFIGFSSFGDPFSYCLCINRFEGLLSYDAWLTMLLLAFSLWILRTSGITSWSEKYVFWVISWGICFWRCNFQSDNYFREEFAFNHFKNMDNIKGSIS